MLFLFANLLLLLLPVSSLNFGTCNCQTQCAQQCPPAPSCPAPPPCSCGSSLQDSGTSQYYSNQGQQYSQQPAQQYVQQNYAPQQPQYIPSATQYVQASQQYVQQQQFVPQTISLTPTAIRVDVPNSYGRYVNNPVYTQTQNVQPAGSQPFVGYQAPQENYQPERVEPSIQFEERNQEVADNESHPEVIAIESTYAPVSTFEPVATTYEPTTTTYNPPSTSTHIVASPAYEPETSYAPVTTTYVPETSSTAAVTTTFPAVQSYAEYHAVEYNGYNYDSKNVNFVHDNAVSSTIAAPVYTTAASLPSVNQAVYQESGYETLAEHEVAAPQTNAVHVQPQLNPAGVFKETTTYPTTLPSTTFPNSFFESEESKETTALPPGVELGIIVPAGEVQQQQVTPSTGTDYADDYLDPSFLNEGSDNSMLIYCYLLLYIILSLPYYKELLLQTFQPNGLKRSGPREMSSDVTTNSYRVLWKR